MAIARPTIRVDKRLEAQRVLMRSTRKKLLRGVFGAKSDGFLGVQDTLFNLDESGEGYLDERVFVDNFLARLKSPLTRAETEFLLTHIRMRGEPESSATVRPKSLKHGEEKRARHHRIDYEQMGIICNLDSDASLSSDSSDSGDDSAGGAFDSPKRGFSPAKVGNRMSSSSNLGADFLAAEKRVQVFLELAEVIDTAKSGFLREEDFHRILGTCSVDISPAILGSILSRFPRATTDGLISYTAFLQRYGQNPHHSRERRKLKRFLLGFLPLMIASSRAEWIAFLKHRFEKYDAKLHAAKCGEIPEREFLHVLHGKSGPLRLSVEQAIKVHTLFLAVSPGSSPSKVRYHEFIRFVQELPSGSSPAQPSGSASAPAAPPSPSPPTRPDASVTGEESVGDFLMSRASRVERRNFEQFMDLLHAFHERLPRKEPLEDAKSTKTPEIVAIANGVRIALGENLRVSVQFSVEP